MAYKAFNHLINCKVDARGIELPANKLNIFNRVYNSIKSKSGYRIIILLGLCTSEVAIKLLKLIPTYIFLNNVL